MTQFENTCMETDDGLGKLSGILVTKDQSNIQTEMLSIAYMVNEACCTERKRSQVEVPVQAKIMFIYFFDDIIMGTHYVS